MSARVTWTGLDELKAALRNMPRELADEGGTIVRDTATRAAATVVAAYEGHQVTGHLAGAVKVETTGAGPFGAAVVVKVNDPIAWLFDNGSQARHWAGGKSTGTMWGKTPPTHVFVGTMIRARRQMYTDLKGLLARQGLSVSGDP